MTFSTFGEIISSSKSGVYLKVVLLLSEGKKIVVTVPDKWEAEMQLNTNIGVAGQINANEHKGKWYNNLFVESIFHEEKRFILIKKEEGYFKTIEYSSTPFIDDKIDGFEKEYRASKKSSGETKETGFNFENIDPAFWLEVKTAPTALKKYTRTYFNLENKQLQSAISRKLVKQDESTIELLPYTGFFLKESEDKTFSSLLFYKDDSEKNSLSIKEPLDVEKSNDKL